MSTLMLISTAFAYVASIPVVDVDGTIFIQGAIYIGLVFILNPLLFKPWLAAQAKRVTSIDGALAKAKSLRSEADELSSTYDAKLAEARDGALTMRSQMRREEEATQAKVLADARTRAGKGLDDNRERIAKETDAAREALGSKVDELASQITNKILGRAS